MMEHGKPDESSDSREARYLQTIRAALAVCRSYRPKFGKGRGEGYALEEFRELYARDCFYAWFGLDCPLVYAAHRAAGGITSIYRQIGIACERVFGQLLQDSLGLTPSQASWSYTVKGPRGTKRLLSLDARIPVTEIQCDQAKGRVDRWLADAAQALELAPRVRDALQGAVFEVRQGYKSKDSKRQNADVANAANAYAHSYLPVACLLSMQMDDDIADRYMRARWLLLRGNLAGTALTSTYAFCRDVLGYDLAAFFQAHEATLRGDVEEILEGLLK